MNEQQLLHDYEREALHHYRQSQRSDQDNPSGHNLPSNAWEALLSMLGRIDYAKLFRIASRLLALAGLALLTYTLHRYFQVDGLGALGSAGHYAMGCFFTFMTFVTGKHYSGFNFLFLLGLLGIVATF